MGLLPNKCDTVDLWNKKLKEIQFMERCKTKGAAGVGAGQICVFPAAYEGVRHKKCIKDETPGGPWCFTEVNSLGNGVHGSWGTCDEGCYENEVEEEIEEQKEEQKKEKKHKEIKKIHKAEKKED